ncbi:efflux RND transporter periplasmic adaptor subunit [Acinetobacter sp. ANC 3791]|uniref:efflux RND transporter periplasmic adaptor subunit n=1 Tax=Acinetobacter sp. ANC 3791 TaxID=2529836 RepID=UPI00103EB5CA|nr:efflux RND transporter periplasmic adaptor subunit [Acinetobacter sp. ANC 3791]TCB86259.1 efflux RND transporter periplasmic adaptor subunit [Acinetobacter sp. ANC 3791]
MQRKKLLILVCLLILVVGTVAYFFVKNKNTQKRNGPPKNPTSVQVSTASQSNVPVILSALGTVTASQTVSVTSLIQGHLQEVYFKEGQYVQKGQLLAKVDTRSYEATLQQYQGQLAENQAQLNNAKLTLARYQRLYAQDSIAKQDLDTQIATAAQYEGAIKADLGQIASAKLNIEYGRIVAPISGYIGIRNIDVGNLVSTDATTAIATITQTKPIAVVFSIPQTKLDDVVQPIRNGGKLMVKAYDQQGKTMLAEGEVRVISNEIDSTTGTVKLKATFNNDDNKLFPNQFVNVKLQTGELNNAIVVPSAAIQTSTAGQYVFVIDQKSVAHKVMVKVGPQTEDGKTAILSGVKTGQKVVTTGVDSLGNGSKVNIVTAQKVDTSILDSAPNKGRHSPR